MKRISRVGFAAATAAWVIAALPFAAGRAEDDASPIFGVRIPAGYRQWELIAPSHVPGFDELRGILGNPVAMTAYRAGTLPFPDGTVLAKLAWKHVPSANFDGAFAPGPATTVQFMVKDANKYPATGGWGFGRFPPQMEAFRQAAQRPAFQARAELMFEIGFQRRSDVELRLGDYIERIATQCAKK